MDIYIRAFFKCSDCGFMFSLLGAQAKYQIEGECPSCSGSIDYPSKVDRENYIKELKEELGYM